MEIISDVLDDYNFALERKHDPGVSLIHDALKLAKPTLEFKGKSFPKATKFSPQVHVD